MSDDSRFQHQPSLWDYCRWLMLFRTFGISIGPQMLILGTLGAFLTAACWHAAGWLFLDCPLEDARQVEALCFSEGDFSPLTEKPSDSDVAAWLDDVHKHPKVVYFWAQVARVQRWPGQGAPKRTTRHGGLHELVHPFPDSWKEPYILDAFYRASPEGHGVNSNLARIGFSLFGLLGTIAVWGLFGGALSRIAVVRLATHQRVTLGDAVRFAFQKWRHSFLAPVLPLLGVVVCAALPALLGLLMQFDVGAIIGGLLWVFVLLSGFLMALLLLGLMFGWPLMLPTIGAEGRDALDALNRPYSYTMQRPLRYLAYATLAFVLGLVGWVLVSYFAAAVVGLAQWSASWGTGNARMDLLTGSANDRSGMASVGAGMMSFWNSIVYALANGYIYSFFFTASSAIYLLLRFDTDHTPLDDVYLPNEEDAYELPALPVDEAGVAGVPETGDPENSSDSEEESPPTGEESK